MQIDLKNKYYTFETDSGWSFRVAYGESPDITAGGMSQCTFTGSCEASIFNAVTTVGVPMGGTTAGQKSVAGSHKITGEQVFVGYAGSDSTIQLYKNSVNIANLIGWLGYSSGSDPQFSLPLFVKNTQTGEFFSTALYIYLSSGAWLTPYDAYITAIAPESRTSAVPGYGVIDGNLWGNITGLERDIKTTQRLHSTFLQQFLENYTPVGPHTDPYTPDGQGESTTGGGDGTFDDTSVPVTIPALPTISAVDTKFISLYNPSLSELQGLASYMWSSFDLNTFRKLFADPMDCILGLSIVPVAVPDGGQAEVKVGNIGTGVMMNKAAAQYVTVDCGSITVERYWGAYLDYAPYTRAEIYLPYIGAHALAMDDIMGKTVHVVYNIDILSGACAAFLECNGTVLYTFTGQCSSSIPISGNDFTSVINGILGAACSIGSTVLSGGAAAPAAVSSIASLSTNVMKPTVEKSGAMAGTGGMLSIQVPYLILTRPKQAIPGDQNREQGYPSFITAALGDLSGYTEVESVHLSGIPCTSQELVEIEAALKEGVIL